MCDTHGARVFTAGSLFIVVVFDLNNRKRPTEVGYAIQRALVELTSCINTGPRAHTPEHIEEVVDLIKAERINDAIALLTARRDIPNHFVTSEDVRMRETLMGARVTEEKTFVLISPHSLPRPEFLACGCVEVFCGCEDDETVCFHRVNPCHRHLREHRESKKAQ